VNKEKLWGGVALFLGLAIWPLLVLGVFGGLASEDPKVSSIIGVYVVYGLMIALFYFLASLTYRATAFGNMVLLGPQQLPHLHAMVEEGAKALGMDETPKAFLYNSNGLLNAFARRLLGGRYLFLTSALVEVSSDEQVRFVIGHELGHHAAGHLNPVRHAAMLPAHMIPFLMPAYSRARELTCDRIGAHLSKDLTASRSALMMLGCGCGRVNPSLSCEPFMAQEAMVPPVFGFLTEIVRSHPRLTRRAKALQDTWSVQT
jgi:Zn-dependent protease with chaperone function